MVVLMLLMGISSLCAAQTSSGGLTGVVTDSTGAAIAGATVEITSANTGEKRSITTNEKGVYNAPNLEPGNYTVEVKAEGFNVGSAKDVKISVSFTTNVSLELKPGGQDIIIEVNPADQSVQINTTDQQLSTLIDNKKILELPLLSRDPNALILLAPGVFPSTSAAGGFSVNGARDRNNNFQVDGVDNNDTEVPGIPGGVTTPNIDATQEFRVITNNFNAEFGRNTGAIINVATKGGTNEYHGGVYEYNRSDTFSARNFFDITGKSDPLHRNQFGGTFGGPILKNKLFFFGAYERDIFNVGNTVVRTVPSASARLGVLTNTPFGPLDIRPNGANNAFGFGFSPAIVQLINSIYPLGNSPLDSPFPGTFDAFRFNFTQKNRVDDVTTRIDYQLGSKTRIAGRYGFNRGEFPGAAGAETFPGLGDSIDSLQRSQLLAINVTSIFTPNLVNEFRFGVNRVNAPFFGQGDGTVPSTLGDQVQSILSANGVPFTGQTFGGKNGSILNVSFGSITGLGTFDTQTRFTGTTTFADNVTYIRGNHSFKAGFETRYVYSNGDTNFGRSEVLSLALPTTFGFPILVDSRGNEIPTTGSGGTFNNFASSLYGLVAFQQQTQLFNAQGTRVDNDERGFRVREFDIFFQDTWKLRSNFTLNYGVRYEFKGVPFEVNGLLSTLVDQDPSGFTPQGGFLFSLVGKNSPNENIQLYDDDYNNIAPRFGFAWDPFKNGKTSIRGGYGVFYDRVFGNLSGNSRGNLPFNFGFQYLPATGNFPDDAFIENVPRPPTVATRFNAVDGDEFAPNLFPLEGKKGNNPYQKQFRNSYSQNFNFGFQRELLRGLVVEADYVGVKGTKLLNVVDGNLTSVARKNAITGANNPVSTSLRTNYLRGSLNTAFNIAFLNTALGFSTYHAFTLRVTKTLSNAKFGLGQIQGAYTFSHSIDNTEDPLLPTTSNRSLPRDSSGFAGGFQAERGPSGNDTRNRFVMNFIYEFPFKAENKVVNTVIGGFSMSGIFQVQSGNPYGIFVNGLDTQGTGLSARARYASNGNGVPAPNPANVDPRLQTGPSVTLFARPSVSQLDGQPGNVPRGAFVGPGFNQFDFSVTKRFSYKERHTFVVRADFFNLFNRVNFALPVSTITDPRFGQSLSTKGDPRIIQFVFRYNF